MSEAESATEEVPELHFQKWAESEFLFRCYSSPDIAMIPARYWLYFNILKEKVGGGDGIRTHETV